MGAGPGAHISPLLVEAGTCLHYGGPDLEIFIIREEDRQSFTSNIARAEDVRQVGLEVSQLLYIPTVIHHAQLTSPAQV